MSHPARLTCQRCTTIRTFVAIAAMLIVAMPLIPDKFAPLAGFTPAHFAYALMGLGSAAFALRWAQWRRANAQKAGAPK